MRANQSSVKYFLINSIKIDLKSEGLGVLNYISLHVWALALGGIQHGDKIGIFMQW